MPVLPQRDSTLGAPRGPEPRLDGARSAAGLHAVALFEATKGVLVLLVGFGLLALVHHDAQHVGEDIVERFHLNLAHHHPRILIDALAHLDNSRLRSLAVAALLYSAVR